MRLSEAIILGSMACPKAKYIRLNTGLFDTDAPANARCAIGAAELACGCNSRLEEAFPWIMDIATDPVTGERGYVNCIIAKLNNGDHGEEWSREAIADWVATVEPKKKTLVQTAVPLNMEKEALVGR